VYVNGGQRGLQARLSPQDLVRLLEAIRRGDHRVRRRPPDAPLEFPLEKATKKLHIAVMSMDAVFGRSPIRSGGGC